VFGSGNEPFVRVRLPFGLGREERCRWSDDGRDWTRERTSRRLSIAHDDVNRASGAAVGAGLEGIVARVAVKRSAWSGRVRSDGDHRREQESEGVLPSARGARL